VNTIASATRRAARVCIGGGLPSWIRAAPSGVPMNAHLCRVVDDAKPGLCCHRLHRFSNTPCGSARHDTARAIEVVQHPCQPLVPDLTPFLRQKDRIIRAVLCAGHVTASRPRLLRSATVDRIIESACSLLSVPRSGICVKMWLIFHVTRGIASRCADAGEPVGQW